jgi:hypothetical protein
MGRARSWSLHLALQLSNRLFVCIGYVNQQNHRFETEQAMQRQTPVKGCQIGELERLPCQANASSRPVP